MTSKDLTADRIFFNLRPNLPPILDGHPDAHFRSGVQVAVSQNTGANSEGAFFVADLSEVYRLHMEWKRLFPSIKAHYAVKTNPDPHVIRLLASLGYGFDCATQGEIQHVLDHGCDHPSRIIYANPTKAPTFIHFAAQNGVDLMTFDNHEELGKISSIHPKAKLVLRLLVDDSHADFQLGKKFGASLDTVPSLLRTAKKLGLDVVGVSYHVGSGNISSAITAHVDAIRRSRLVFDMAKEAGFRLDLLDIGGGFEAKSLEGVAKSLLGAIDQFFSDEVEQGLRIIAEPGQYFVSTAFQLAACIIGRRGPEEGTDPELDNPTMYYINDGIYGSFDVTASNLRHEILYSNSTFHPDTSHVPTRPSIIWGPTCCPTDLVFKHVLLPESLRVGDWLKFQNMGAYTISTSTRFNGFEPSRVLYTSGADPAVSERIQNLLTRFSIRHPPRHRIEGGRMGIRSGASGIERYPQWPVTIVSALFRMFSSSSSNQ